MNLPRYDITGEIGEGDATGAAVGRFCDENPGRVEVVINSFGGIASGTQLVQPAQEVGQNLWLT